VVAGLDHVELINLVDKARLVAQGYHAEDGKESVNFSFPFSMPGGQVRVEVPFGVVRPDVDQIPSACKNWFTMGRWADVSNDSYGVTWVSMDAPLVQVGGVTANLLNSHTDPKVWRREVGETQTLVSWAMNNHWGTNYRAYQEGPVVFRYLVRPHSGYDAAVASRFAVPASQPLLPVRARGAAPQRESLLRLGAQQLLVTGLKPADDGPGVIVRIWNAGDEEVVSGLQWRDESTAAIYRSDTSERAGEPVQGKLSVGANEMVTIRVE
jgi:alpha-mannosidase